MKHIPDEIDRLASLARCILLQAAIDATSRIDYKSPYQTREARKDKASALRFFRGNWFKMIARALHKNPDEYRKRIFKKRK
jgi:hypothetical protein